MAVAETETETVAVAVTVPEFVTEAVAVAESVRSSTALRGRNTRRPRRTPPAHPLLRASDEVLPVIDEAWKRDFATPF